MPNLARRQLLANLQASLAALPGVSPEQTFLAAVTDAGLKDKPFFTPEEAAMIGRALMQQALKAFEQAPKPAPPAEPAAPAQPPA